MTALTRFVRDCENGSPIEHARRRDHISSATEQQFVRAIFPTQDVAKENDVVAASTFAKHLRPRTHLDERP